MNSDKLLRESQALRERLARLSQTSLRINESLDFDTVLQDVVDRARADRRPDGVERLPGDVRAPGERPSPELPGRSAPT